MIYKTLKKVSNYCQLLDKSKFPATQTINGVTFTNNGDGTITANGTATSRAVLPLSNEIPVIYGKGLIIGDPEPKNAFINYYYSNSAHSWIVDNASYAGKGTIFAERYDAVYTDIYIAVEEGTTANNLIFKPQLFDLTEMYGVGNEPTTVEEFKADFPNDLYDYKPYCFVPSYKNCLIHPIPITSGNLIDFPYASAYDTRQGMTFSQVDTYKVHASGVNNNYNAGVVFDFIKGKTLSAGTYTIKYYTEGTVTTDLYFRGRKNSYYGPSLFAETTRQKTFTLTEDTVVYIAFGFVGGVDNRFTGETIDLTVWCRLERGTDVTDYISSYKKSLICTTKNLFDKSLVRTPGDLGNATLVSKTNNGWIVQGNLYSTPGTASYSNGWFSPGDTAKNNNQGVMLKGGDVVTVSAYYTVLEDNSTGSTGIFLYGVKSVTGYVGRLPEVGIKTRRYKTLKVADGKDGLYYPVFTLNSSKILIEDIQVEYGTTPTEYHHYGYL